MKRCKLIWMVAAWTGFELSACFAQTENTSIDGALERMARPWTNRVHRLIRPEFDATLKYWAGKHPGILNVSTVKKSREGVPIQLLKITDPEVADRNKQVALITALHGGPERTGPTTAMRVAEWLLSDEPEARKTRERQIVLLMPINNPYAFFETDRFGNSTGIDPYTGGGPQNWDFKTMTYKAGDSVPEVQAFLDVVDKFQPEVHVDLHGTGLQEYRVDQLGDRTRYQGQTMFEVTGSAYSNYALRPWDWRVTEAMIAAGEQAGYPSDRYEADAQRAYWGPAMQPLYQFTWRGRPNFYTAQYAYARYHTMVSALEVGWEASGLARVQGMLNIGNSKWLSENRIGYPVDRVRSFIGHYVTAWGRNAAERRRSRIELWGRQPEFTQAVLYPQTDGRDTYVVAIGAKAAALLDSEPANLLTNLNSLNTVVAESIGKFIKAGPEIKLAIDKASSRDGDSGSVKHGIGFRLRLPYRNPDVLDVRLNGHLLARNSSDGFEIWRGNGYTQLQINVPPGKADSETLFFVSCIYLPDERRAYGWMPPNAVMDSLKEK